MNAIGEEGPRTALNPLLHVLERRDRLSPTDVALIEALPLRRVSFATGQEMVVEGSRPKESCLILTGFAARSQALKAGTRQITALHVAGDFVDLHALLLKTMDHSVVAIGHCEVAFILHTALRSVTEASDHLTRMLWLSTVIDGAIQRAWITCLGRRSAEQHMAHLLCELYKRLEAAGEAQGDAFDFPVTQAQLGDALGLSIVHVNRKLQELRATGLVDWKNGKVTIHNFGKLAELSEFDPTYLSLQREPR